MATLFSKSLVFSLRESIFHSFSRSFKFNSRIVLFFSKKTPRVASGKAVFAATALHTLCDSCTSAAIFLTKECTSFRHDLSICAIFMDLSQCSLSCSPETLIDKKGKIKLMSSLIFFCNPYATSKFD